MKSVLPLLLTAATADALLGGARLPDIFLKELHNLKQYAERRLKETNEPYSPSPDYPYWNIFPAYMSSVLEGGSSGAWTSKCFETNSLSLQRAADGRSVTATVLSENSVEVAETATEECIDFYLLACTSASEDFVVRGSKKRSITTEVIVSLPTDITDAEWYDIDHKGFRLSLYPNGPATTFSNLLETVALFEPAILGFISEAAAERNLEFLNQYTGFDDIVYVDPNSFQIPDESLVHDGDFFAFQSLTGLGPMMAWATGATTGHTTVAQRIDGELYICESTTPAVQCTPYLEYMDEVRAGGNSAVWAPLRSDLRGLYNATAALEYFRSVEGTDYGFRTLLWGWIDDAVKNMPCLPPDFSSNCGDWRYFETSLAELDRHSDFGKLIWNPGMAKRLGVSDELSTSELYQIADGVGLSSADVIEIPEQDVWMYNTTRNGEPYEGADMVCDVFVCHMWKAGGLFGELADDINCGEMTNWDVYVLDILEPTYTQIMGNYTLELQFDYNSKTPYAHMAEHCDGVAPDYDRGPDC